MTKLPTPMNNQSADLTSAFLDSLIDETLSQPTEKSSNHVAHVAQRDLYVQSCANLHQDTLNRNRLEQAMFARAQRPAGGGAAAGQSSLVERPKSPTAREKEMQRRVELQKQEFYLEGKALLKRHATSLAKLEPEQMPAYPVTPFALTSPLRCRPAR